MSPKKPTRGPKPVPVQTFAQVVAWIAANYEHDRHEQKRTDKQRAMWFFAYREAESWVDMRTKDIADVILTGMPKLTRAHIDEQLRESVNEGGEDYQLAEPFDLTSELREFWGVKS